MISLREWPTDRVQIKLRSGIRLFVVLKCSPKPFSFLCCHLNLPPRCLTLSAGCSRPNPQCLSCLFPFPQGPMISQIKQENGAFNNRKQAHSFLMPSYTAQSSPAVSSGISWLVSAPVFAGWLSYATCFLWALHVDWWALEGVHTLELPHKSQVCGEDDYRWHISSRWLATTITQVL